MNSLIDSLLSYFYSLKKTDTNYYIAKYIISHFEQLEDITIKDIVDHCYTSPTTLNKFCQIFGFRNYALFKENLVAHKMLKTKQALNRLVNFNEDQMYLIYKQCSREHCLSKEELYNVINQIVDDIYKAKDIVFYGAVIPLSILTNFKINMMIVGKVSYDYTMKTDYDKDDLLFIISFTGRFLVSKKSEFVSYKNIDCNKVLVSQEFDYVKQYLNDYKNFIPLPGKTDYIELNYMLMVIFDLIFYFYAKKYAG